MLKNLLFINDGDELLRREYTMRDEKNSLWFSVRAGMFDRAAGNTMIEIPDAILDQVIQRLQKHQAFLKDKQ